MKTSVFVAVIDPDIQQDPVYPRKRQEQIENCSNENVRLEKYTAWRLLECAFKKTFGISMESLCFSCDAYGKWHSDKLFFSISHSGGAVAVAVSDLPVGVDIEVVKRYHKGIENKILTPDESSVLENIDPVAAEEYIIKKWSEKESIFKTLDRKGFEPLKIETAEYPVASRSLDILDKRFVLSVCSQDIQNVEYFLPYEIEKEM